MSEATHLLGTWVGSGEALVQGTLHSFTQTETVTPHLDGELLTIEGVGHDPDDDTRRTHLAFAVLSYDVDHQRYQWRAYSAGHWADTELRLTPQGFSWTLTSSRSDTLSKIVDVAARLLQEQGPAAVTTRGVAEAAGVHAPTIYRLFGDKDALLDAVAEHVMATYVSAKAAIVQAASADNADPLGDLRASWEMQIDFGVANPTLFGLLSDPARGRRSPAAQSGRHVLESRVHRIALTGRLRVSEQRAVDLIHSAGTGTVLTILSTPPEHRDPGLADGMYEAGVSAELEGSSWPSSQRMSSNAELGACRRSCP